MALQGSILRARWSPELPVQNQASGPTSAHFQFSWEFGKPPTPRGCQARATSWGLSGQATTAPHSLCSRLVSSANSLNRVTSELFCRCRWDPPQGQVGARGVPMRASCHRACSWPPRNVSSDGAEARRRLREYEGLVDALLHGRGQEGHGQQGGQGGAGPSRSFLGRVSLAASRKGSGRRSRNRAQEA